MRDSWLSIDDARRYIREGTGQGIRVAVLDSGVEVAHQALQGLHLVDDAAFVDEGLELKEVPGNGHDVFGHGTAVASIIRQIAPGAELGSFRVLGEQLRSRTLIIREAARRAIQRGYHILNCSFGCGREDHVLLYKDWIDAAYVASCHVVAACNNVDSAKREWPGHFPSVIAVNFVRGQTPETLFYRRGSLVEFMAQGVDLDVAWRDNGRRKVTGSSFATAHVTGLLARLLSAQPHLPPLLAKAVLHEVATPASEAGLIDA